MIGIVSYTMYKSILLILFVSNESYIHGLCQEVDLLFTYMSFCCDLETVQEISLMGFTSLSVLACFLPVTLVLSIGTERDIPGQQIGKEQGYR